jgi:23S rRNA (pseudouridine1915-N3)-methyltransferase
MRLHLLAVGRRLPAWQQEGYETYARRLGAGLAMHLTEIPTARRRRSTPVAAPVRQEGERMLAAVPPGARVVALDERGERIATTALAAKLDRWRHDSVTAALLVGGPDGLAPACLSRADERWSLSDLTLPHGLARVILAEQIYRAWSLLHGHPYHRE